MKSILAAAVALMLASCSPAPEFPTLEQVTAIDEALYAVEAEMIHLRSANAALEVRVRELEHARPKAKRHKQRRRQATPRRSICPLFGL